MKIIMRTVTKIISKTGFFSKSRRVLVTGIVLSAVFICFIFAGVVVKAQSANPTQNDKIYYTNITVGKGDTLWSIAERYMDYSHYDSIYDYMDCIRELNRLTSDNLYAGRHLMVVYYRTDGSEQ